MEESREREEGFRDRMPILRADTRIELIQKRIYCIVDHEGTKLRHNRQEQKLKYPVRLSISLLNSRVCI
jgi:hypothetical protein